MIRCCRSMLPVVVAVAVALAAVGGCKDDGFAPVEAGLVRSTFDSGDEGWTALGDPVSTVPEWFPKGGNGGGHVMVTDAEQALAWYWRAPAKFHGDRSDAYGRVLRFDLTQSATDAQQDTATAGVVLTGAGMTVAYLPARGPGLRWTVYRVPLRAGPDWFNRTTNRTATEAEMRAVLGALSDFIIRGEFRRASDQGKLDNVIFGIEP